MSGNSEMTALKEQLKKRDEEINDFFDNEYKQLQNKCEVAEEKASVLELKLQQALKEVEKA